MAILAVAALIPYVALTSDQAKSPVVGDIFVPIAAMFGALLIGQLNQTGVIERSRSTRVFVASVGGAVFAIGLSTQLGSLLAGQIPPPDREHLPEADRLAVTAGDYIQNYLGGSATWSTDAHLDYDFSQAVTAYYFERTGRLLHIRGTALGDGAVDNVLSRTDVLNVAASTDVMVLPDDDTPVHSIYPSDIMIASMLPELRSYASAHMRPLDSFQLFGRSVSVYVRIDPDVQSGTE
ncbi:MAG: hypothetical protein JOZ81_23915 [Chloroflexi bacterium]|nr:hypothetical protein [Chloroflexota bacterium]